MVLDTPVLSFYSSKEESETMPTLEIESLILADSSRNFALFTLPILSG
jgi:hypothetical protein